MARRKRVVDEKTNAFFLSVLSKLSTEQKSWLNDRELKKVSTEESLKRFLATGSREEIEIILTKVGIRFNTTYYDPAKIDFTLPQRTYRQYTMKEKPASLIREMMTQEIFVTGSKDIATALAMMSMNCHSDYYKPNPGFAKVRRYMNTLTTRLKDRSIREEMLAGSEGVRMVENLLFFSLGLDSWLQGRINLDSIDVQILLTLNRYPNNYVSINHILPQLGAQHKKTTIERRCGTLMNEKEMVDILPADRKKPAYRITEAGILALGEISNHLISEKIA